MKCPLSQGYFRWNEDDKGYVVMVCLKEDCAWWDEEKNCCSIKVIAKELTNIQIKMPHEGQFRAR